MKKPTHITWACWDGEHALCRDPRCRCVCRNVAAPRAEVMAAVSEHAGQHANCFPCERDATPPPEAAEGKPCGCRADHTWACLRHQVTTLEARVRALEVSLGATLDRYVSLVNCGDCGHWDPETEPHVIEARALLAPRENSGG